MGSTVMNMVDLAFNLSPSPLITSHLNKCIRISKVSFRYLFITVYSLLRCPCTHLQCQQSSKPLPSNKGGRPPFNIIGGLLVGAEGYRNTRGDPCCGRPIRYMRRYDDDPNCGQISFHHCLPTTLAN